MTISQASGPSRSPTPTPPSWPDCLKEEVFAEGLTRNIPAFSRFFEALGYSHGELSNHAAIARDSGVDAKTVKEYFQILVDTLLGTVLEPYTRRQRRQVITRALRFDLFDVGVAGILTSRRIAALRGEGFGRALEHLVFMDLAAHRSCSELEYPIRFRRTTSGLEVDFVLGDAEGAIEVKGTAPVRRPELRALSAFVGEHAPRQAIVASTEREARIQDGIRVVPWRLFLEQLWGGQIVLGAGRGHRRRPRTRCQGLRRCPAPIRKTESCTAPW